MDNIPSKGYLRLSQIIGNKKTSPILAPLVPVGKTTWWEGVRKGTFPKPVKIGSRVTVWRIEDIQDLLKSLAEPGRLS